MGYFKQIKDQVSNNDHSRKMPVVSQATLSINFLCLRLSFPLFRFPHPQIHGLFKLDDNLLSQHHIIDCHFKSYSFKCMAPRWWRFSSYDKWSQQLVPPCSIWRYKRTSTWQWFIFFYLIQWFIFFIYSYKIFQFLKYFACSHYLQKYSVNL